MKPVQESHEQECVGGHAHPQLLTSWISVPDQLWRFEDQNKHTAELAERAAKVYEQAAHLFCGAWTCYREEPGKKPTDAYQESARFQMVTGGG